MPSHKKKHVAHLKSKWSKRHIHLQKSLWDKHGDALQWFHDASKHVMVGSLAGVLMLSHLNLTSLIPQNLFHAKQHLAQKESSPELGKEYLRAELKNVLPEVVQPLSEQQEQQVASILSKRFNLNVAPELEGKRLNRSYGLIGAEQHLMLYPGDTIESHFSSVEDQRFAKSGMAPGRGAWGYFTSSYADLTPTDIERERWYIAAPTFLAPGWKNDVAGHYAFFKYRKMLVVNPENGKAVVAVIGDAGPAEFTGKHVGGSPEVMDYLERKDGGQKGPVLYYFIDDPDNTVKLGPISVQPTYEASIL